MVYWNIGDFAVFADEVSGLAMQMHHGQNLFALEDVKSPPSLRLSRFLWLTIPLATAEKSIVKFCLRDDVKLVIT